MTSQVLLFAVITVKWNYQMKQVIDFRSNISTTIHVYVNNRLDSCSLNLIITEAALIMVIVFTILHKINASFLTSSHITKVTKCIYYVVMFAPVVCRQYKSFVDVTVLCLWYAKDYAKDNHPQKPCILCIQLKTCQRES